MQKTEFREWISVVQFHAGEGMGEPRIWRGFERRITEVVGLPGVREWWAVRTSWFSDAFQEFMDATIPYLAIEPRDLEIALASDAAVVTFHLGDAPSFDRRTLVFERRGERWLIIHLHASRPPGGS